MLPNSLNLIPTIINRLDKLNNIKRASEYGPSELLQLNELIDKFFKTNFDLLLVQRRLALLAIDTIPKQQFGGRNGFYSRSTRKIDKLR